MPGDCMTDGQIIAVLVVTLVCSAALIAAGYLAGSSDSRRSVTSSERAAGELPDPRKFKPQSRR